MSDSKRTVFVSISNKAYRKVIARISIFTTFPTHSFLHSIAKNNIMVWRVFRFYVWCFRENSRARKRETTQCDTAKLNQRRPDVASPAHREAACEKWWIIKPTTLGKMTRSTAAENPELCMLRIMPDILWNSCFPGTFNIIFLNFVWRCGVPWTSTPTFTFVLQILF